MWQLCVNALAALFLWDVLLPSAEPAAVRAGRHLWARALRRRLFRVDRVVGLCAPLRRH